MLIFGLANEPKLPSLGIPVRRNGAHLLEPLDVKIERLPAVEDCFDDIRREKGKRQEPGDVGRVNRRMLGQFLGMFTLTKQIAHSTLACKEKPL